MVNGKLKNQLFEKSHCLFRFPGSYETPGSTTYKHIYFNVTRETLIIWTLTILFLILGYESFKRITTLWMKGRLRLIMLFLFLVNIYPNYFTWWVYFNYFNDGYHLQFYHQLFFTLTEFVSTYIVLLLCDKKVTVLPWHIHVISGTALTHIIVGSLDQFVLHLILGREELHKKTRDVALLVPDVLYLIVPVYELRKVMVRERTHICSLVMKKDFILTISTIFLSSVFMKCVL